MRRRPDLAVYKPNSNRHQRKDTRLNLKLALAIREQVFNGVQLFARNTHKITVIVDGKEEIVTKRTIMSWLKRRNIIPETGEIFNDFLYKIRKEYKDYLAEKRREEMLELAEKTLYQTLKIPTNLAVLDNQGQVVRRPDGRIVRRQDHNLLNIKTNTAKYITERLNAPLYGRVEKTENKHLVLSLADLRRIKNEAEK